MRGHLLAMLLLGLTFPEPDPKRRKVMVIDDLPPPAPPPDPEPVRQEPRLERPPVPSGVSRRDPVITVDSTSDAFDPLGLGPPPLEERQPKLEDTPTRTEKGKQRKRKRKRRGW